MKFQVILKRDKLKAVEKVLLMAIAIIKARPISYSVYLIYVARQNEIRILVQNETAPIVIVLMPQLFAKVVSVSRNDTENSSIGFEFKRGLSFLENFLASIKDQSGANTIMLEQEKTLAIKITKDKEYRSLEMRIRDKMRREEIEKPTKNENQIFSYEWLDGVSNGARSFELNPTSIIQILKFVSKSKNSYPIQMLEQKKLVMTIYMGEDKANLRLKAPTSAIEVCSKISRIQGPGSGVFEYEIKIDDAQSLMLAIKNQCEFVIDTLNNLSVGYSSPAYNCQICLKNWIAFNACSGTGEDQRLKRQF